ncbi:MAG: hypothetical protein J1F69_03925 [Clostridiales bacterium]|nr:hypothetical protein [Clostridiales bacterium]
MKEKDLHKIIRETGSEDNDILYKALAEEHPELKREVSADKSAPAKRSVAWRTAVFASLAVSLVLNVGLTTALTTTIISTELNSDKTKDDNSGQNSPSFTRDYTTELWDCTVNEYNEKNGTSFLCFDLDSVDGCYVVEYTHVKTGEFLGLKAKVCLTDADEVINYVICPDNYMLSFLNYNVRICKNEATVAGHSVKWAAKYRESLGIFSHNGYDYYFTLQEKEDETRLFELIEILLESQK